MGAYNSPIDRIFLADIYSGGNNNAEQWITGMEIWDGFPCGTGPCYNNTNPTAYTGLSVYDQSAVAATLSNVVWETTTRRQYKSWVEAFATSDNTSTLFHDIANLTPLKSYKIKTDGMYRGVTGIKGTACSTASCKANAKGFIYFKTTLPYASLTHKFEIEVT
jgi:hypothetical protein